jgi:hypothetical protein
MEAWVLVDQSLHQELSIEIEDVDIIIRERTIIFYLK